MIEITIQVYTNENYTFPLKDTYFKDYNPFQCESMSEFIIFMKPYFLGQL